MTRKHSIALFLLLFGIGIGVSVFVDVYDFETYFYPAAVEIAHLRDPYAVPGVYSPPWALVMLAPLGWLPYVWAKAIFFGLMFACFFIVPIKLGFKWWALLLYLISPPVILCLWLGNLEWLCLLGLLLPGPWAIPFYLIKPQVGLAIAMYEIVKAKDIRHVVFPIAFIVVLSFLLFPGWASVDFMEVMSYRGFPNLSLWPWGVVLGVASFVLSRLTRRKALAAIAAPYFSPYVLLYSWSGAVLGLCWLFGGKRNEQV